ncbi:zinc finger MYM-type protein 1-like, partial [Aphis craccivora]
SLKSFLIAPVACPLDHTVESPTLQILEPLTTKKRSLSPNIDESNTFSDKRIDENISIYDIGIFQFSWLSKFTWLAYSLKFDGAFCKFCVAFVNNEAGINSQLLGALVKKPFRNWKHATETFRNHSSLQYHLKCLSDTDNFLNIKKNPSLSIENNLDSSHAKQVMENRKNIIPIIETILLCGQQNLSIRGHRDSGKMEVKNSEPKGNDGNFRSILKYRALGDANLKKFLESPGRIKYISPTSQNAIIDACNSVILSKIVNRVNKAKCFTVLVDETADIAGIEQVSICARYVNLETYYLKHFGIETQYLRGQGFDGAAAMSGKYNGVQYHIKQAHPLAIYIHCSAHSLNLAVSSSCGIQSIRNCLGIVGKLRDFFIFPKRKAVLSLAIEQSESVLSKRSLKRSCETRWIERYHSISDFLELFECVVEALDVISEWNDTSDTSHKAQSLRSSILQSEFIIALHVTSKVFGFGLPLSKQFQKINIDLKMAMSLAQDTSDELNVFRENVDSEFHEIFIKAKNIANKFESHLKIPRISNLQKNRMNITTDDPEKYYRISIFIPYIDSFINQLKTRFIDHKTILNGFQSLFNTKAREDDFRKLIDKYKEEFNSPISVVLGEFRLWQRKLNNMNDKPNNAIDALNLCNKDMYPGNRLNGLAMMSIYRKDSILPEEILDELSKKKRRLHFVL